MNIFHYLPESILQGIKFLDSQIEPNESTKQNRRETVFDSKNHAHLFALERAIKTNFTAAYIDEKSYT